MSTNLTHHDQIAQSGKFGLSILATDTDPAPIGGSGIVPAVMQTIVGVPALRQWRWCWIMVDPPRGKDH
ncbi:MAG: hypothetical protein ACLUOF_06090 [Ruminococcus sp.]